jgi:hypothetical protein
MKGVAELLGVPATPWFDRVITWGQQLIGKVREYLNLSQSISSTP